MSTLVEDSVGSLTERLTELERTVQSQRTTPITDDDVLNMETWSTLEQVIWTELGKVREQVQEVPNVRSLTRIKRLKRDNWQDYEVLLEE